MTRLICLATLAPALGLAAVSESPAAPTRIVAIGDFGTGGAAQERLGAAVERLVDRFGADALVTLGDNDYTQGEAFERNWTSSFGWLEDRGIRVAGTIGNHDHEIDRGRYEFATLGMPRRFYSRTIGPVQLFLLDSNVVDRRQTTWLRRALRTSRATWKIVAFHHPPYTCGARPGHEQIRSRWVPLFERYKVDLVLAGHEHNYQRFKPRADVTYVIHGGGARPPYEPVGCDREAPRQLRRSTAHGFLSITARRERLVVRAMNLGPWQVDRVAIGRRSNGN